jgi:hypothetical protein
VWDASPPVNLKTQTYFVPFVSVILLAPEKEKVISPKTRYPMVVTSTASDVAKGEPVGFPSVPNVPV